jgi:hypothetical protein
MKPGPPLEGILRRIVECPNAFVEAPNQSDLPTLNRALVADLLRHLKLDVPLELPAKAASCLGLLNLAVWVFWDAWAQREFPMGLIGTPEPQAKNFQSFLHHGIARNPALEKLVNPACLSLVELGKIVNAQTIISDPDRREEFARICLAASDFLPQEETPHTFASRLQTLSSTERKRILADTAAAAKRAREIREAMARAKALESASRYGE